MNRIVRKIQIYILPFKHSPSVFPDHSIRNDKIYYHPFAFIWFNIAIFFAIHKYCALIIGSHNINFPTATDILIRNLLYYQA